MPTTHSPPPVGAFLKPVGKDYSYFVRVLCVYPETETNAECIEYERWGVDKDTPVRDGKQNKGWVKGLRQVLPGIWRDTYDFGGNPRWRVCPLYYRLVTTPAQQKEQRGQFLLF